MAITSLGPRIRLFGAALSLACAGPALAQPADPACHMLWHLVEVTPHVDQLMESTGGAHLEALLAFDRVLRRTPPALVANVAMSGSPLADHVPQLVAHVEALRALRREVAQGNLATVRAAAASADIRAGTALAQRLFDEQGCRPSGWFVSEVVAGAGLGAAQMPGAAIEDGAAEPADHAEMRATRVANAWTFAAAGLSAGVLAVLFWVHATLRERLQLSRRHPRYGCGCWTTLEHAGKAHKSLIIDASRLGCRITRPPRFRRGACVTIDVCGTPVSAKVMWRREHFAGLRFVAALDEPQLAALHQSEQDIFCPAAAASGGGRIQGSGDGDARAGAA